MILGNGDIADALRDGDRENLLFFASGVSNSQEIDEFQYARERSLLESQDKWNHVVYFSSLCVFYSNTRYAKHKMEMEHLIKKLFSSYTIMRLGNITWGDNPNTLINAFRRMVKNGEKIEVQDTYRYVVDREEFQHWIRMIPDWSCEMNVTGKRLKVSEILEHYGHT